MRITVIVLLVLFTGCYNRERKVNKENLTGNDTRLFQDTPAWELAKAVQDEDTAAIRKIIREGKAKPDYPESKYGNTLLMLAVVNSYYKSAKALLDAGADPNARDTYGGSTAMIDAAKNDDPAYIKLLLRYKGKANIIENAPVRKGDEARSTPLNEAISLSDVNALEKVKLLVDAGADINYSNDGHPFYTPLPLSDAIVHRKLDVALYLLEKGADYNKVMYQAVKKHDVYILEALRKVVVDLNSEEYKSKLEVIQFLKTKGLDYSKEPVPDYIVKEIKKKYPNDWENYLKNY